MTGARPVPSLTCVVIAVIVADASVHVVALPL